MIEGSAQKPAKKPHSKDQPRRTAQPNHERGQKTGATDVSFAPAELIPRLKGFLDLVVRETTFAITYEISEQTGEDDHEPQAPQSDGHSVQKDAATGGEESLLVRFRGEDEEILLARNGEMLLALEYLAHRWLGLPPALHERVRFECGDFRATRLEELKLSARVAAQRVRETGQPFEFNPMSSRDRRTIHLELTGAPGVRTISEGSGDRRHLVIYPAGKK
jgi:predicted RNA-binding protein Jag